MISNNKIKVIGISGSLRRDSYNRKALQLAKQFAVEFEADVDEIDLKELDLPLYDADLETHGFPTSVQTLRDKVEQVDILVIASPEYNHSISAALKNAIDWLSTGKNILNGKVAAIFGASTGQFGTMRAQLHLRQIFTALNTLLISQPQVYIRNATEVFDHDGTLKDSKLQNQLRELIEKTIKLTKVLKENK
jgi:chromate reductase